MSSPCPSRDDFDAAQWQHGLRGAAQRACWTYHLWFGERAKSFESSGDISRYAEESMQRVEGLSFEAALREVVLMYGSPEIATLEKQSAPVCIWRPGRRAKT